MRVAAAQLATGEDMGANPGVITSAIDAAAAAGAQLAVLPEYSSGWASPLHAGLAGPAAALSAAAEGARRHRIHVLLGVLEPAGQGRARNVAVLLGPDGQVVARYVKAHLFDAFGVSESDLLESGPAEPCVVRVGQWRVGVAICYDLRFPELFRALVDAGAEAFLVIAAWADGPGKAAQLRTLAAARAIENTAPLVLAAQCGPGRAGRSVVIGPLGEILAEAGGAAAGDRAGTGGEARAGVGAAAGGEAGVGGEAAAAPGGAAPHRQSTLDVQLAVADLSREDLCRARRQVPSLEHRRFRVVPASTPPSSP